MPTRYTSSADTHAMVAPIAPNILELLGDGIPRSRRAFVAALADRYPKEEVELTLMRLAVTGQVVDVDRRYTLAPTPEPESARGRFVQARCRFGLLRRHHRLVCVR